MIRSGVAQELITNGLEVNRGEDVRQTRADDKEILDFWKEPSSCQLPPVRNYQPFLLARKWKLQVLQAQKNWSKENL